MPRTALLIGALAVSFLVAAGATGEQAKQRPAGPPEQPDPLGFPGIQPLTESLMLTAEQSGSVHHLYGETQKKELQVQQEAAKAKGRAEFRGADLSGAHPQPSRLDGSDVSKAVLAVARLERAWLVGCRWEGASLENADFRGPER